MDEETLGHGGAVLELNQEIDHRTSGDIIKIMTPKERRQPLSGFEAQYSDIIDYIIRITHRIWEEGDMGYIYDTYQHNCKVHTAYGLSYGVHEVVGGSIAFLAAFPDRRAYAEDIIWAGDDQRGFFSSHLLFNKGINRGYSPWGAPTQRPVEYLALAECAVKDNFIYEEWLIRDTGAILQQLGFNVREVAQALTEQDYEGISGEPPRLQGQLPPEVFYPRQGASDAEQLEDIVQSLYQNVWNRRNFAAMRTLYHDDVLWRGPYLSTVRSVTNLRSYFLNFLAQFPDGAMQVEQSYANGNAQDGYRVSVRWRFRGTHQHFGWYGKPTRNTVEVLGLTHLHIQNGKIAQEIMLFDDLALQMELCR